MALGIISDEDFDLEVNKFDGAETQARVVTKPSRGRAPNDNNVPDSLRAIVAEEAINGTPASELERTFGVSRSSITAYKHGATSTKTYDKPNEKLQTVVERTREKIHSRASHKLLSALKHITEDKLADTKAGELSSIAANMSRVIEKTSPKEQTVNQTNIVFYSPAQIHERNFEVVDIQQQE